MGRCALITAVCCLTLAASGDDLCLLRLAAPSLPAKTLPLDDPNSDFTASADPGTAPSRAPGFSLTAALPAPPSGSSPAHPASPPGGRRPPRPPVATPLRC